MKNLIKYYPHKFLFRVSLFFGLIGLAIWKYDKLVGYSFQDQGPIEQFFRLIFGSMLLLIPQLLLYSLIYWLMHKFKRPTLPKLNSWHIYLLFTSVFIQLIMGLEIWLDKSHNYNFEKSPFDYFMIFLAIVIILLFLTNVILSLVKPSQIQLADNGAPQHVNKINTDEILDEKE